MPSFAAARHTSSGSPDGSAAASSTSRWVWAGKAPSCLPKLSSIRPDSGIPLGSPNPPASCSGVSPHGSSSRASGLPRVSAMILSRTRASSGPVSTESSSARASRSRRPCTVICGSPASSSPGSRAAKTRPTGSAASRRATNPRTCADARSRHCSSSTTHTSGRSSATADSRSSAARPMKKRFGAGPALMPNVVRSASRCGTGSRPR